MRVELLHIGSTDVDLRTFEPARDEKWCFYGNAELAPVGEKGADNFQFGVCSEAWMKEQLDSGPVAAGRLIVFRDYSFARLENLIAELCDKCAEQSRDWDSFARRINWFMQWEFENYRE